MVWGLSYIFNVPNIKRITLLLFLQCYILYQCFIDSLFSHMASTVDASLRLWRHLHGTFGVRSLSKIPAKDSRQMKATRMEREERNDE